MILTFLTRYSIFLAVESGTVLRLCTSKGFLQVVNPTQFPVANTSGEIICGWRRLGTTKVAAKSSLWRIRISISIP